MTGACQKIREKKDKTRGPKQRRGWMIKQGWPSPSSPCYPEHRSELDTVLRSAPNKHSPQCQINTDDK